MKKNKLYLPLLCLFPLVVLGAPTIYHYLFYKFARNQIDGWVYMAVMCLCCAALMFLAAYLGTKCQKATLPGATGRVLLALGILFVVLFAIAILLHTGLGATFFPATKNPLLGVVLKLPVAYPYCAYCLGGAIFYFVLFKHYRGQKPASQLLNQPPTAGYAPLHPVYAPQPPIAPREGLVKKNKLYLPLLCIFPLVVLAMPTIHYYLWFSVTRNQIDRWVYMAVMCLCCAALMFLLAYLAAKCQKAALPGATGGLLLALGILFVVLFAIAVIQRGWDTYFFSPTNDLRFFDLRMILRRYPHYAYCFGSAIFYFVLFKHYQGQKPAGQLLNRPPTAGYAPSHPAYTPQPPTAPQAGHAHTHGQFPAG